MPRKLSENIRLQRFLRFLVVLMGIPVGIGLAQVMRLVLVYLRGSNALPPWMVVLLFFISAAVCAVLALIFSQKIIYSIHTLVQNIVRSLLEVPFTDLLFGAIGLILGLVIAYMVSSLFDSLPAFLGVPISVCIFVIFGCIGMLIGAKRWHELPSSLTRHLHRRRNKAKEPALLEEIEGTEETEETEEKMPIFSSKPKILDTSVIIDGRIYDVCKTGFMEGPLVVAEFMLKELRHIADAAEPVKRSRGRRGLDVLGKMQKELDIEINVDRTDFEDVEEVDIKLLKLARLKKGCIVTNDYNLNKVAEVSGIQVLNLNDLANAVKPVAMAGEEMKVAILREGKEINQGVGYLNDGTMIVVENGRSLIGTVVDVVVTSVLQTSAGRMIFARVKESGQ